MNLRTIVFDADGARADSQARCGYHPSDAPSTAGAAAFLDHSDEADAVLDDLS